LRFALIAAMVGLPFLAGTPAAAKPIVPNENSVQATIDGFLVISNPRPTMPSPRRRE
jgi:hypothetical protein